MRARTPAGSRRLSRSAEFERVYRQGRSTANRQLVLYSFPNSSAPRARPGCRYRARSAARCSAIASSGLLRSEAFARVEAELAPEQDIVVVARPEIRELAERDGLDGVSAALGELLDRARLREPGRSSAAATRSEDVASGAGTA